jgi:alanyl-tRNA synthetase
MKAMLGLSYSLSLVSLSRIENIDENLCCGTHVANLSQLQAVKLLYTESKEKKGYILSSFLSVFFYRSPYFSALC